MKRLTSLDICRGIAVICMVAADIPVITNVGAIRNLGGLIAAPFFIFIAGVSFELFVISRKDKYKNIIRLNIETFWKAIILLGITQTIFFVGVLLFPSNFSLGFNSSVFGFNSSVFLVIAVGYLLSIFIPGKWIYQLPFIILPFLISTTINNSIPGMLSFLFRPPFPLIPFISYFFLGRAVMIFYEDINDLEMKNYKIVIFSALFVVILEIIIHLFNLPSIINSRTQIPGFLLLVGLMIFILSLISVVNGKTKKIEFFLSPFEGIGRIAFSTYYAFTALQFIVYPYLNRVYIINSDQKIQILAYYISILIILVITATIEKTWQKVDYKFGMEWIIRRGSSSLTKLTMKSMEK